MAFTMNDFFYCFVVFLLGLPSWAQNEAALEEASPKDTAAQTNGMSAKGTAYSALIGSASAATVK